MSEWFGNRIQKAGALNVVLLILAGLQLVYAGYFFYNGYYVQDHAEHLHAAWLVWTGEVPYRDFFEHHNPLLWWILAPVVALFYLNPLILYVARLITVAAFILFVAGFYRICRQFLKISAQAVVLAFIFLFGFREYIGDVLELRPDFFMWAAFIWGVYFYFGYLASSQQKMLNYAMILFVAAFLFLQKILVQEAVIGCHLLWMVYRRKIAFKAVLRALVVPVCLLGCFLFYLFYTNSYYIYFILNYDLNTWMPQFMWIASMPENWQNVFLFPALALLCLKRFDRGEGAAYRQIMVALMLSVLAVNFAVWGPWPHYYIFSNLVAALVVADEIISHINKLGVKVFLACLLCYLGKIFISMPADYSFQVYYQLHRHIMANTTKDDVLINGTLVFLNIYNRNPSYYWFGYQNIVPVAYALYGYGDKPDINAMIYQNKPKFLYGRPYFNQIVTTIAAKMQAAEMPVEEYIDHLAELYDKLPVREDKNQFMTFWLSGYYQELDSRFISLIYQPVLNYPLLVRRDLAR